jgi:hypothetical protein
MRAVVQVTWPQLQLVDPAAHASPRRGWCMHACFAGGGALGDGASGWRFGGGLRAPVDHGARSEEKATRAGTGRHHGLEGRPQEAGLAGWLPTETVSASAAAGFLNGDERVA